jgi:hypothetical protein
VRIADVMREEGTRVAGERIDVAFLNGGAIRGGKSLGPPTFAFANEEAPIGRRRRDPGLAAVRERLHGDDADRRPGEAGAGGGRPVHCNPFMGICVQGAHL